jgi:CDP-glycerol glycerophosphotransferase
MRLVDNTFGGRFADGPRAIFDALGRAHAHVWVADGAHRHALPEAVPTVELGTPEGVAVREAADVDVVKTQTEPDRQLAGTHAAAPGTTTRL